MEFLRERHCSFSNVNIDFLFFPHVPDDLGFGIEVRIECGADAVQWVLLESQVSG